MSSSFSILKYTAVARCKYFTRAYLFEGKPKLSPNRHQIVPTCSYYLEKNNKSSVRQNKSHSCTEGVPLCCEKTNKIYNP